MGGGLRHGAGLAVDPKAGALGGKVADCVFWFVCLCALVFVSGWPFQVVPKEVHQKAVHGLVSPPFTLTYAQQNGAS